MKVRPVSVGQLAAIWDGIVADDLNPQPDGDWFGAYDGSDLVGASHLVRVGGDELFDDLWVRPDRRGQGIGRALVAQMQKLRRGLWLIADPDRVAFYEALGFRVRTPLPAAIAERYARLGLWPGHLDHLHVAMHWAR